MGEVNSTMQQKTPETPSKHEPGINAPPSTPSSLTTVISSSPEEKNWKHELENFEPIEKEQGILEFRPQTFEKLQELLQKCVELKLKIVPWGSQTSHEEKTRYQVSINLTNFNKVVKCSHEEKTVTVESGVTCSQLIKYIDSCCNGWFWPQSQVHESATIGGVISSCAVSSINEYRFGSLFDNLESVTVMYSNGFIDKLEKPLLACILASNGSFGIVLEATLRLHPKPQDNEILCVAGFSDIQKARTTLKSLMDHPILRYSIAQIEVLSQPALQMGNSALHTTFPETPTLFMILPSVLSHLPGPICQSCGAEMFSIFPIDSDIAQSLKSLRNSLWSVENQISVFPVSEQLSDSELVKIRANHIVKFGPSIPTQPPSFSSHNIKHALDAENLFL